MRGELLRGRVREFIDCCANGSDYACDIVAATVGMIFPVGNVVGSRNRGWDRRDRGYLHSFRFAGKNYFDDYFFVAGSRDWGADNLDCLDRTL